MAILALCTTPFGRKSSLPTRQFLPGMIIKVVPPPLLVRKTYNERLTKTKEEFIALMLERLMDKLSKNWMPLPANMECGVLLMRVTVTASPYLSVYIYNFRVLIYPEKQNMLIFI